MAESELELGVPVYPWQPGGRFCALFALASKDKAFDLDFDLTVHLKRLRRPRPAVERAPGLGILNSRLSFIENHGSLA